MHLSKLPGTATSVAPIKAVLVHPSCLAAAAGKQAFKSGVIVK
jgi:hypothetical protein